MQKTTQETSLKKSGESMEALKVYKFTKARVLKNLVVLSLTSLLMGTAAEGLNFLQSTMNKEVGIISIALQNVCGCLSALFLPKYLIRKFGNKLVIVVSMFVFVPYLVSNFYPVFGFMIPASILAGFGTSLVFNSLSAYLNNLASLYTRLCLGNDFQNFNQFYTNLQNCTNHTFIQTTNNSTTELQTTSNNSIPELQTTSNNSIPELQTTSTHSITELQTTSNNSIKELQATSNDSIAELSAISNDSNTELRTAINNSIAKLKTTSNESDTELQTAFDNSNKSVEELQTALNNSNASTFARATDRNVPMRNTFSSEVSLLNSVSEKSLDIATEDRSKPKHIVGDQQIDSFPIAHFNPDNAIKVLETTTSRFFGFFGCLYQLCHILCNVISYSIFQTNSVERDYIQNSSCVCGSDFCSIESACFLHDIQLPSTQTRYTLTTVYVIMGFLAALFTLLFLDDVNQKSGRVSFSLEMAIMTFKFHRNKNQLLLIPLSLYVGMIQAFITGDFTKDFIGCAWGVEHISLVMISTGCAISLSSGLYALLVKYIGRCLFFCIAAVLNLVVNVTMLHWDPDPTKPTMMFVIAGMWGIIVGVMWCQVRAFIGLIFKEEEETAFGCYQLWHALGCAIVYAYNSYLCTYLKIYILLTVSTISAIGYLLAERNYFLIKKRCTER